jgi:hypothetical protein
VPTRVHLVKALLASPQRKAIGLRARPNLTLHRLQQLSLLWRAIMEYSMRLTPGFLIIICPFKRLF